ncbi:hypothetical protein BCR39DRAFT_561334 [Naematelia encephala]|uniref:Uncharacterized protein n=1 Tax=Naematelia encephala TaxID=71784 RepID=A0A1Y2ARD0_9TREE|nr:hypothetical protein BCR39DRAFT_561334 [Naematelia encephala]
MSFKYPVLPIVRVQEEKIPLLGQAKVSRSEQDVKLQVEEENKDDDIRPSLAEASRLLILLVFAAVWTGLAIFLTPLSPTPTRRTIGWILVGVWASLTTFLGARLAIETLDLWRESRMRERGRRLLFVGDECEKTGQV